MLWSRKRHNNQIFTGKIPKKLLAEHKLYNTKTSPRLSTWEIVLLRRKIVIPKGNIKRCICLVLLSPWKLLWNSSGENELDC